MHLHLNSSQSSLILCSTSALFLYQFAATLRQEHGGGSVVIVEDGQEAGLVGNERVVFERLLPLNNKQVVPASEAPKDETVVRERKRKRKEYV